MTDKRLTIKRIILFVLLAFSPYWIFAELCDILGILQSEAGFLLTTALAMLTPAAASLITRRITGEGMGNSLLRLKGGRRYYLLAIALPLIYTAIGALVSAAVTGNADPSAVMEEAGVTPVGYVSAILMNIAVGAALLPIFLGEELGWRGYLTPKLKMVMNRPAAYITGGVIWGLWHTPAIIDGLNFGSDYPGYPFTGVLMMCLFCTGVGIIFTWLTEKTNSVYPAALAHAVNNNAAGLIKALADTGSSDVIADFSAGLTGILAAAVFCIAERAVRKTDR